MRVALPEVSEHEAKQCLLRALPSKLQQHVLQKQAESDLSLENMEKEVLRKTHMQEQLKSMQQQLTKSTPEVAVVQNKRT